MPPRMPLGNPPGTVAVVGHRGAPHEAPENTLASIERALALGVDAVEIDVHVSRDGVPVVIHDHTLDRTTDGRGLVSEHTFAELQRLDAGSWFDRRFATQRLPRLDDVLALTRSRCRVLIEIKNAPVAYRDSDQAVLDALRRTQTMDEALVISFDHTVVRRMKESAPELATGVLLAGRPPNPVAPAQEARADALLPQWTCLTAEMVNAAHAAKLIIIPWTVDEPQEMQRLITLGVDAIVTNRPDLLLPLARKKRAPRPR